MQKHKKSYKEISMNVQVTQIVLRKLAVSGAGKSRSIQTDPI